MVTFQSNFLLFSFILVLSECFGTDKKRPNSGTKNEIGTVATYVSVVSKINLISLILSYFILLVYLFIDVKVS